MQELWSLHAGGVGSAGDRRIVMGAMDRGVMAGLVGGHILAPTGARAPVIGMVAWRVMTEGGEAGVLRGMIGRS